MDLTENQDIQNVLEKDFNQDKIFLKGTSETPEVALDKTNGTIKLSGRSLPEDARSFYKNIVYWLNKYAEDPKQGTHAVFVFEYFNTASSKMILELLDILKEIEAKDENLKIDWHYMEDDDDMLEAGEDFAEIAYLTFNYISYE